MQATEKELTDFVVEQLVKHRNRDDLIMILCQNSGMNWYDAEKFIVNIESEHSRKIATGQSPVYLILGVGILVVGLFITGRYVLATLHGAIYFLPSMPIPYSGNVGWIGTGIAMTLGGIVGIVMTIKKMIVR